MWQLENYLKYLIGIGIAWALIYGQRNIGCTNAQTDQMQPLMPKESYFMYFPRDRSARDFKPDDLVLYEHTPKGRLAANNYVARVIALPGDKVKMEGGTVIVNGNVRADSFVKPEYRMIQDYPEIVVPRDHIYVLADFRKEMRGDSRAFGPISTHAIVGKVKSPGS